MPQFVLLRHTLPEDAPRKSHWDFMLQSGSVLRTWALERAPEDGLESSAEQLADHRLEYLELEGELSGNRGQVSRLDRGAYQIVDESAEQLSVTIHGEWLRGRVVLQRTEVAQRWRFFFFADADFAGSSSL